MKKTVRRIPLDKIHISPGEIVIKTDLPDPKESDEKEWEKFENDIRLYGTGFLLAMGEEDYQRRFEGESKEVYEARRREIEVLALKHGQQLKGEGKNEI